MKRIKKIFNFILLAVLGFSFLKSIAFFVPDINAIGRDPVITKAEPAYLIPGMKVKLYGNNFLKIQNLQTNC